MAGDTDEEQTQGCLNFDPRRAAGDTVIMFSCGGRADGGMSHSIHLINCVFVNTSDICIGGATTNSQLFPFAAGESSFTLAPENANGATCLVNNNGKLDEAACSGDASQLFTAS